MPNKKGTCAVHASGYERIHGRIDEMAVDMTKVNITLFGDPSKNVEGFLQMSARQQERVNMWMKIWTFVGSTLTLSVIGVFIKMLMK